MGQRRSEAEQLTGIRGTVARSRLGGGMIFYETKTRGSACGCIREALGQLLEYAYWPGAEAADQLIIVGEPRLDVKARTYLEALLREFVLTIDYKSFNPDKGTLK
jgi:hypothetical protein